MVKMYPEEEVKKVKQDIERKNILAELKEYLDDDLLLGPFNSKFKTVPTSDFSSKLCKSHCTNYEMNLILLPRSTLSIMVILNSAIRIVINLQADLSRF